MNDLIKRMRLGLKRPVVIHQVSGIVGGLLGLGLAALVVAKTPVDSIGGPDATE